MSGESGDKIINSLAENNKQIILEVLLKYFDSTLLSGDVLEIASGTGQHIVHFAQAFPHLTFHPTEVEVSLFKSIEAHVSEAGLKNVYAPIRIDIKTDVATWLITFKQVDYVLNINMTQNTPFICTMCLFENVSKLLKPKGLLVIYGPFAENGVIRSQRNKELNSSLRRRDPRLGIRELSDLQKIAEENGFKLIFNCILPSNNKCLVWEKNKL